MSIILSLQYVLSIIRVFVLKSILPDISMAPPTLYWLLFAWYTFFHSFIFNLFVSFNLIVSPLYNIWLYLVFSVILPISLLIGKFNTFTFCVVTKGGCMYVILSCVSYIFYDFFCFSIPLLLPPFLLSSYLLLKHFISLVISCTIYF